MNCLRISRGEGRNWSEGQELGLEAQHNCYVGRVRILLEKDLHVHPKPLFGKTRRHQP